jgi:hypothetical protein
MPARPSWRVAIGVLGVILAVFACAAVVQHDIGWNEYSHFAQVRAFERGTPIIDRYRHTTGDRAIYHGHFYSDKAPGLGFFLVPVYRVARATGLVRPAGVHTIHLLVLFGCVLPLAVILLLGYSFVERRDPGMGAAAAVTLGFATLLLPFATMLFSHVFSASLGFAAFWLLWRERERGGGLGQIAAAGVLAGYAISTEYPMALLAILLGAFVAWRKAPARALCAYGAGVIVGLVPLLAYDWWAFGSPFHLSYSYVGANSSGVLGVGAPNLRNAVRLLVADRGLFVVTPVTAAAIAGIVILYREGRRLDALVPAAVVAAYFGYNACYYLPFGGGVPGPRFLITVLPFLTLPLAAAYRKAPIATLSLAAVSAATMAAATITVPVLSTGISTHIWWSRLLHGRFSTTTASIVLFGLFALGAIIAAGVATPRPKIKRLDLELTALAIGSWVVLRQAAPALFAQDLASGHVWGLAALIAIGIAVTATVMRVARGSGVALLAGVPMVMLALRRFDHTTLALILAGASLALLVALGRRTRTAAPG